MWAVLGAKRREILVAKLMHEAAAQIRLAASLRDMWQFYLDRFFGLLRLKKRGGGKRGFNKLFFFRIIF